MQVIINMEEYNRMVTYIKELEYECEALCDDLEEATDMLIELSFDNLMLEEILEDLGIEVELEEDFDCEWCDCCSCEYITFLEEAINYEEEPIVVRLVL